MAAANKFAAMLRRNKTPRIAVVLIYTLLEWALIAALLANAAFASLIAAFADFFSLHPPCALCSRIDHLFGKSARDLLCPAHAAELAHLPVPPSYLVCTNGGLERIHEAEAEEDERSDDGDDPEVEQVHQEEEEEREVIEDESVDLLAPARPENRSIGVDERLVPVELIDSLTLIKSCVDPPEREVAALEEEDEKVALEEEEDHSSPLPQLISVLEEQPEGFGEFQACEEDGRVTEISIGSEIGDQPHVEEEPADPQPELTDEQCSASSDVIVDKEQVTEAPPAETAVTRSVNELFVHTELNEVEDERVPETPTSVDGLHALHKRFLFEKRESGTESMDGSVASEIDGNETPTVENLKVALKAERKALSALYAELEEERSASAIAANQTMAMITRLQEEKAAVQMEALQYQRMMEEQSEYDQEALQLLNELVMKREKEKQELEKELEVYRKKVLIYEVKERRKIAERSRINGNGCASSSDSSNSGDSDDLSFECHEGDDCNYNQNTPTDDILSSGADHEATKHLLTLDESLADFEEERLSILEQLKALEEKLFSMEEDENGHGYGANYQSDGENGFERDLHTNGKLHHSQRTVINGGKSLLPLFDAAIAKESEDGMSPEYENTNGSVQSVSRSAIDDQRRLAIAEEVDNVYERLQALEADREFLKHCIRSLKKGDKGMDLLQEILQHLRDLRDVELRVKDASNALSSLSAA